MIFCSNQLFKQSIALALFPVNLFLDFVIVRLAIENNCLHGTEIAIILKKSLANFDNNGYSVSCAFHQFNGEISQKVLARFQ